MEKRPQIEIGYRVGMLTVTDKNDKRKNGYTIWARECDCGREITLDTRCLQRGTVTDCGCVSVAQLTLPIKALLTGPISGYWKRG